MKKHANHGIRRLHLLPLALLSSAMLITGCGGASKSSYAVAETAAAYDVNNRYDTGADDFLSSETAAEAAPMESEAAAASGGITQNTTSNMPLPLERKLIRNVTLNVETLTFDDLLSAVQTKTAALGGYVEQSDISGNSITHQGRQSKKYASLILRIPADQLNAFITQVETDGNVTYKSETVSDVTLQYSDIESRLKTLRMEQDRLWELLAKAESTESIIALEQRLTEVSSEIETSESRLRHFDNSVTYSTVYLTLNEVDLESPTQPETAGQQIQRGFLNNLNALGSGLSALMIGLLSNSPVILFLALIVMVVFFIVRKVDQKKQKKRDKNAFQNLRDAEHVPEKNQDRMDEV